MSARDLSKWCSAMMASIIGLFGLPTTVGSFLPCSAKTRGDESEPEPGVSSLRASDNLPTQVVPPVG